VLESLSIQQNVRTASNSDRDLSPKAKTVSVNLRAVLTIALVPLGEPERANGLVMLYHSTCQLADPKT
jgi:hypothetical protein